jgi:hypothetical protein
VERNRELATLISRLNADRQILTDRQDYLLAAQDVHYNHRTQLPATLQAFVSMESFSRLGPTMSALFGTGDLGFLARVAVAILTRVTGFETEPAHSSSSIYSRSSSSSRLIISSSRE